MKKHIDYKVPNGKLIRVDLELENNIIEKIKITGDFFIHPEESIILIENSLKGTNVKDCGKTIRKVIGLNKIKLIGLSERDLEIVLTNVSEDDMK